MKEYVIGFIEGCIDPTDFFNNCYSDDKIFDWLQSIVPEGLTCYKNILHHEYNIDGKLIAFWAEQQVVPYDIRLVSKQIMESGGCYLGKLYDIHSSISSLVSKAFPNEHIVPSEKIKEKFNLMLSGCPDYIGGNEVEASGILESLIDSLPNDLSKTSRQKLLRTKIKEMFHISGQKYPRWLQEPEWPMHNGVPMRFLYQKKTLIGYAYVFEDIISGEKRTIEQFT